MKKTRYKRSNLRVQIGERAGAIFVNIKHETDDAQDACGAPDSDSEMLKLDLRNGLGVKRDYDRRVNRMLKAWTQRETHVVAKGRAGKS